jgi:inner membrane protein
MRWSAGFRFLIVGLLTLLMFIPLFFVGQIINERSGYSRSTQTSVGNEWGGKQSVSGPQMVIPVEGPVTVVKQREVTDPVTGEIKTEEYEVTEIARKAPIYLYPNKFDVAISTISEERRRGIFRVPVYSADTVLDFTYDLPEPATLLNNGEKILWDETILRVTLSSNKALRGAAELRIDEVLVALEPRPASNNSTGGIFAVTGDPRGHQTYQLKLGFNGAGELLVAPVGRNSAITMTSDWPHPSFTGEFLPDRRAISDTGFEAQWMIPHLARSLPQVSRENYDSTARKTAFGVRFYQPNDFYQKAYRAARHGILFIALTFLTVLLIEHNSKRPAHPVQYILIGLAQSIFVLLMVAYAEQFGFAAAYALASVATIGLLVMFGFVGLKLGRRTWVLGTMLVILYAVLYMILRSADYALLAGSTLAFLALGGTMYATRNEDWYGPDKPKKDKRRGPLFGVVLPGTGQRPPPAGPPDPEAKT